MAVKKTTKKTTKKKSIDSLEQTHGKLEDTHKEDQIESAVTKARELDVILGMRKMSPFGTASLAVFEEDLAGMNLTDMRELAVKSGIFPSGNRTILKKKLLKGFSAYNKGAGEAAANIPLNKRTSLPDSELQKSIDDIWAGKK
jgi:hypothetical protein